MKRSPILPALALATAATLGLSSCAANEAAAEGDAGGPSGTLEGVGSSAQATAQSTWIADFQRKNPRVTVDYDPQGSGAGRSSFLAGAADFAGSDVALSADELAGRAKKCAAGTDPIDLPVYLSPIALAYHVEGLDDLRLDAATIAGIFRGTITRWDDPALKTLNPGAPLPDARITVVHRSDDSGTTQNFTEYLAANASKQWGAAPSQTFPYDVGDAAKGTSGVASALAHAKNSIGYIDESGASGLSLAKLKVGDGFSTISADGAAVVVAASPVRTGRGENDLAIDIERTGTKRGTWPLVLVSYLITCQDYEDDATASLVRKYAASVASAGEQKAAAKRAGSAPLSTALAEKVASAIRTIE